MPTESSLNLFKEIILHYLQVNYEELARCTDDFNGAMLKAVCVEAGMIALRREATELIHEDYMDGILEVQSKKKSNLVYYAQKLRWWQMVY